GAGPVRTAEGGKVTVRVEERRSVTEAELTLRPLGGPVGSWRLLLPPKAEVKVALEAGRFKLETDPRNPDHRTLRLTEPTEEPPALTVTLAGEPPRPGAPLAVGPFLVLGTSRQSGSVVISSTAPGLRLECRALAELTRRELTEEEKRRDGV